MSLNNDVLISLKNIDVSFKGKHVLSNFNLDILKNKHVYISGKNGSGKTTLVKAMLRLIKPNKGSVDFAKDVRLAYLPEMSERVLHIPMLVKNFLSIYTKNSKLSSEEIDLILSMLGVDLYINSSIADISAGTLQKVLIARCFIIMPNLVILDEPFNYIDEEAKQSLLKNVLLIAKSIECSLVLIDHNITADALEGNFTNINLNNNN